MLRQLLDKGASSASLYSFFVLSDSAVAQTRSCKQGVTGSSPSRAKLTSFLHTLSYVGEGEESYVGIEPIYK